MEIVIIAIWLLIMMWSRKIALEQGRSGKLGLFWGFWFGLFAVIAYAIAGDTQKVKDAKLNVLLDAREGTLKK